MQLRPWIWVVAHANGSPAITAPRENTSGATASSTPVIAPPADNPVTYTREASTPFDVIRCCTICRIDVTCGPVRVCWFALNQSKHALFAVVCG